MIFLVNILTSDSHKPNLLIQLLFQAMVQCVSSSEPDSVVSPVADSAQSPSANDYIERSGGKLIFYKPKKK